MKKIVKWLVSLFKKQELVEQLHEKYDEGRPQYMCPECLYEVGEDETYLAFRMDGYYNEEYDRSTGTWVCDGGIDVIFMEIEPNKWIRVDEFISDDLYAELSDYYCEWYKDQPRLSEQDIKDIKGDIKFHEMVEEGLI